MDHVRAAAAGQDSINQVGRIEAQLAALQQELDHAHQLATLGTLTAGIAHEINNILTPVLAYAQLARANPADRALGQKALERAIAGVESASRITEAVLGFAHRGEQPECADVGEVLEASLACIGRDPARDGIDLSVRVACGLSVRIRPLALQQVLMNLVINAGNAMAGQGGRITIEAVQRPEGNATIVVADTGPGIPEELLARLFDPFVSGAKRPQVNGPRLGGSGLGLAVCRRLIETAGGTIDVASVTGEGATFTIRLPVA